MPSPAPLSIESLCAGFDIPTWVKEFDHAPGGKVVFGAGTLDTIGTEAQSLGAKRVLIVSDPGLVKTGTVDRARRAIEAEGIAVTVFDETRENPTTRDVARCVEAGRQAEADLIVGLGGGSSMDTAKGCNFILTNGGEMKDYQGIDLATKPMLPLIAARRCSKFETWRQRSRRKSAKWRWLASRCRCLICSKSWKRTGSYCFWCRL